MRCVVNLWRYALTVTVIVFLASATASASLNTTAIPSKEILVKEFSAAIQDKANGRSVYTFDTANEIIEPHKSSPFDVATDVTVKGRFVRTDLTNLLMSARNLSNMTETFNARYNYMGRNITPDEVTALKNELLDVPVSAVKGTITYINQSKINFSDNSTLYFSIDLSLEKTGYKTNGKLKFGAYSEYLNISGYGDFGAGVKIHASTTEVPGSVVLERGLTNDANTKLLLHLDETGGTSATDSSGNGNTGTLNNGAYFIENGAFLDGKNDYISVPNSASLDITGSAITVEGMFYPTSFADTPILVDMWYTSGTGTKFVMYITGNGRVYWLINTVGGDSHFTSAATVPLNQWTHIAGVYDGENIYVYIGGIKDTNSVARTGNLVASGKSLEMGTIGGGTNKFAGKMDEIRISNTARYTSNFIPNQYQYHPSGTIASWVSNSTLGSGTRWTWLNWSGENINPSIPTNITFKVRASDWTDNECFANNSATPGWVPVGGGSQKEINLSQYNILGRCFQWNATLTSGNDSATPQLDWVTATYETPPINITFKSPADSSPTTPSGEQLNFNVGINQIADVSWYLDGALLYTNNSVTTAWYNNSSGSVGTWNVTAIAGNANGSDSKTWAWTVSTPINISMKLSGEFMYQESDLYVKLAALVKNEDSRDKTPVSDATVRLSIYYPDETALWVDNAAMNETSNFAGVYTWSKSLSQGEIPSGVYVAYVKATYGTSTVYDMVTFNRDPSPPRQSPVISVDFLMALSLIAGLLVVTYLVRRRPQ